MHALLDGCRRAWAVAARADAFLLTAPIPLRRLFYALTLVVIVGMSLPRVPRMWLDYSELPLLHRIAQPPTWGPDTLSDMYGARVVLNDPSDMFTKARLDQTPLEAATWSREASAPYPPAVLLAEAGLYAVGERLGLGFYGMILGLAALFLAVSAWYFWRTRWYLFPALYLNFVYFSERFVCVQDNTYLVMLTVVMAALVAAPHHAPTSQLLMAIAITMKLSPLYYATTVTRMRPRIAGAFLGILALGLVAPYFIWENYLYIYRYGNELKGDWNDAVGALAVAGLFGLVIAYVDAKRGFDAEERVGWGLVPFAMFLGLKMNVARHLLIVLLVPDKHGLRNIAAAVGLALPVLLPGVVRFNAALPAAIVVLAFGLAYELDRIGWTTVGHDLRHPRSTLRAMLGARPAR